MNASTNQIVTKTLKSIINETENKLDIVGFFSSYKPFRDQIKKSEIKDKLLEFIQLKASNKFPYNDFNSSLKEQNFVNEIFSDFLIQSFNVEICDNEFIKALVYCSKFLMYETSYNVPLAMEGNDALENVRLNFIFILHIKLETIFISVLSHFIFFSVQIINRTSHFLTT